ncbi:tubby C-terminal domain-like protein [Bacillus ndiopicus]|uniref:tubby C-terminal domain-like protein n=1 Tax=Bacillus ndiopicus TaxID=1347368 RepID=UPI0005A76450|nr:hypothetical protein [Bacillus ndiopicus]
MYHLILLFILLQLAIFARFLIYGLFSVTAFASTFLFLTAALFIWLFSKKLIHKEQNYKPNNITSWSYYERQTTILSKKPLFKGDLKLGYIRRYFEKKWQHIVSDILGSNWYLALEVQINEENYLIRWNSKNRLLIQEHWTIYKNGMEIGRAHTLNTMKNTVKLKEVIEFTIEGKTFTTSAASMSSAITLQDKQSTLGTMKRNHIISNVHLLDAQEDCSEYLVALITHAYYFKRK